MGRGRTKSKSIRGRVSRLLGHFTVSVGLLSLALAGFVAWVGYSLYRAEFPDVSMLRDQYPVVIYRGKDEPFDVKLQRSRPARWVSLGQISRFAIGAVVVSEDWAFYQHHGYDPAQLKDAIEESIEEHRMVRGASTITQQVVKNVFLTSEKSLWRKAKELYLAIRLERAVGKRRILETYLNIAEWGEGVFGIQAAARHYFGKPASDLTAKEGAFLAMLLPSPKRYAQSFRRRQLTEFARDSIDSILAKMLQAHYLTDEQRATELATPLSFETPSSSPDSPEDQQAGVAS